MCSCDAAGGGDAREETPRGAGAGAWAGEEGRPDRCKTAAWLPLASGTSGEGGRGGGKDAMGGGKRAAA